ncbi:MAG: hypothetical protein J6E49_03900, partial [Acidaminococcaceae bacterium]|nr:hypothetical protein [Acidaminococcaceae bacterium]
MKKMKLSAVALAAAFAFAAVPAMETEMVNTNGNAGTDKTVISFSRPAFAQGNGVDYQVGLHYVPLVTRTERFVESDDKGELLRARWTGIRVTGPVPF